MLFVKVHLGCKDYKWNLVQLGFIPQHTFENAWPLVGFAAGVNLIYVAVATSVMLLGSAVSVNSIYLAASRIYWRSV